MRRYLHGRLNRRGIARFQGGDVQGALADFREAALVEPNYAEPWNNSGLLRQTLGQLGQAVADFDRALGDSCGLSGGANQPRPSAAGTRRCGRRPGRFRPGTGTGQAKPRSPPRSCTIAAMLRRLSGDMAGACADFDQALQIDPAAHRDPYLPRQVAQRDRRSCRGAGRF